MGRKIISNLYVMATILFVVGGLLIYQGEDAGPVLISIGLLMNVIYRVIHINIENIKALRMLDVLKLCSAVFLGVTVVLFFIDFNALEYVMVAMLFDIILNIDDLLRSKKVTDKG